MRKQDYLIHLIQSLSPNESRYFKLFSSIQPGDKEYVRLFEALENRKEYDAVALCKELDMNPTQLGEKKHYLSQVLLKSIRQFKDGDSLESFLLSSILDASELSSRGLYDYALDVLDKALTRARNEEEVTHSPAILSSILSVRHLMGRYNDVIAMDDELKRAHKLSAEMSEMSVFNSSVTKFEQSRRGPDEFPIPNHPFLTAKPGDMESSKAQMAWFTAMNAYYVAINDLGQMLELVRSEVKFYESKPRLRDFFPYQFLVSQIRLATAEGSASIKSTKLLIMYFDSSRASSTFGFSKSSSTSENELSLRMSAFSAGVSPSS